MERPRDERSGSRTAWLSLALAVAILGMALTGLGRADLYAFTAFGLTGSLLLLALWKWGQLSSRQILAGALLLRVLIFWLPPSLSDDSYRYVWDGLVQAEGINPYLYTPDELSIEQPALYEQLNSQTWYSVYPPVSQAIFFIGALLGGDDWLTVYYLIKLLLVAAELGGVFLLARLTGPRSLLLYAWNPLVVLETAGQAHTEALAVLFLIGTVFHAGKQRPRWAAVALALAGWVKLYPFVLFPFLWRRFGWKAVWPAALLSAIVVAPYFHLQAPGHVAASLDLYVRYFEFNAGFYYGIKQAFLFLTGNDVSKTLGPLLRTLFLAGLPVLYFLDRRQKWTLRQAFVWTLGFYFLCATTVHPWYILGLFALVVLAPRPAWHWLWLGAFSLGTYLLYADGPYWTFVVLGWGGWFALAATRYQQPFLNEILRTRARGKVNRLKPHLPLAPQPLRVLDLGAGEGYVGEILRSTATPEVVLADVVNLNRTALPHVQYDGRNLPFDEGAFDVTVLYFVLHHAEEPAQVVREALRVTSGRVIVIESVYRSRMGRIWLEVADRLVNRLRSGGLMKEQEAHLCFRSGGDWRDMFEAQQARVITMQPFGGPFHRQVLYVLEW